MSLDKKKLVKSFSKDYLKVLNGDLPKIRNNYPSYVLSELCFYLDSIPETPVNKSHRLILFDIGCKLDYSFNL